MDLIQSIKCVYSVVISELNECRKIVYFVFWDDLSLAACVELKATSEVVCWNSCKSYYSDI